MFDLNQIPSPTALYSSQFCLGRCKGLGTSAEYACTIRRWGNQIVGLSVSVNDLGKVRPRRELHHG